MRVRAREKTRDVGVHRCCQGKVFVVWCLYLAALEREELLHDGRDEGCGGLFARGNCEGQLGLLLVQVPL